MLQQQLQNMPNITLTELNSSSFSERKVLYLHSDRDEKILYPIWVNTIEKAKEDSINKMLSSFIVQIYNELNGEDEEAVLTMAKVKILFI